MEVEILNNFVKVRASSHEATFSSLAFIHRVFFTVSESFGKMINRNRLKKKITLIVFLKSDRKRLSCFIG